MKTIRLSCAHALFKYLIAQKTIVDGKKVPLFPGAFAIYGHGNVACLGQAMEEFQSDLPGYRGHHEQSMALSGIGYARAMRRKQIFIATSSSGPGAMNMVTAAGVALSNRLPLLLLPGDVFASRFPDPVLQQVENFNEYPSLICVDLNNTAFSEAYRKLRGDRNDTFVEAGRGLGMSYSLGGIPYRIDFIFSTKQLKVLDHQTHNIKLSDHRPISAKLNWD